MARERGLHDDRVGVLDDLYQGEVGAPRQVIWDEVLYSGSALAYHS